MASACYSFTSNYSNFNLFDLISHYKLCLMDGTINYHDSYLIHKGIGTNQHASYFFAFHFITIPISDSQQLALTTQTSVGTKQFEF